MLRHVFIINVKEGISDDVVEQISTWRKKQKRLSICRAPILLK